MKNKRNTVLCCTLLAQSLRSFQGKSGKDLSREDRSNSASRVIVLGLGIDLCPKQQFKLKMCSSWELR